MKEGIEERELNYRAAEEEKPRNGAARTSVLGSSFLFFRMRMHRFLVHEQAFPFK